MANWFTRLVDRVTPWDRGGEVQRRKKREEEEAQRQNQATQAPKVRVINAQPTQRIVVDQPKPQQPVNIFETLNQGLPLNKPQNIVPVLKDQEVTSLDIPQPGTVVKPNARQLRAIEEGKRANELVERNTASNVSGFQKLRRNVLPAAGDAAYEMFGRPIKAVAVNPIESGRELLAQATGNKEAQLAAKRRNVKNLFSKETLEKSARGEKLGKMDLATGVLDIASVLPVAKSLKIANVGAKEAIATRSLKPFLKGAAEAVDEALLGVRNLFRRPGAAKDVVEVVDNAPRPITIEQNIPVTSVDDLPQPVNVRSLTEPKPLIRELGGDARVATPDPLIKRFAQDVRDDAARMTNNAARPDMRIEGVNPRSSNPTQFTPTDVKKAQDKLVDDYATVLRDVGEGNGVAITPDGKRISNNFRPGDTKGKKMSKADWRDEAESQIKAGKAPEEIQKAYNDLSDADVQSLIAKGEQPDLPTGRPIQVKEVKGISVADKTDIPQNLPETPGKVRVTQATAPSNAKSAAVAAETSPVPPTTTKATAGEVAESVPTTPKQADEALDGAYERLVKSLKENQAAQRVEKKITKAEKSRRFADRQRIYDDLVASGVSRKEAEQRATAALKGKYSDNAVANFDVDSKEAEAFRKAIDEVSDDPFNTKRAFEHMIDPTKTDPLQPWERTRIRQFVQKTLGDDAAQALEEAIVMAEKSDDKSLMGKIASFATSVTASGDISATGRQGLQGLINHPGMSKRAFTEAMGALTDPKKAEDFVRRLVADPDTAFIQENMGTHYLSLSKKADEARGGSDWAENFVGTKWFVNPSERHYNTYLDSLRHQQTKAIIERYGGQDGILKAAQAANPENPDKWMKAWGKVINAASGRGTLGKAGNVTVGDVQVLFSARNLASKFQRLAAPADLRLLRDNPSAYLYQLKEVGTTAAALGTALLTAQASGLVEVEKGKIKIGNSRYDITGGFATIINSVNNVRKGLFDPKEGGFSRTGLDVGKDFLQNQLSPMVGGLARLFDVNYDEMKDKYGNSVDEKWLAKNALLPAPVGTAIGSQTEGERWGQTASNLFANALGVNVNTYQSAADKKAAASGSSTSSASADSAVNTTDKASFEAQAPKEGFSIQQLDDGSYAYSINGKTHQTDSLKKARQEVAKAGFEDEEGSYKVIGDKVYRKDADGEATVISKTEFDYKLGTATLTAQKRAENLDGWMKTANSQLDLIEKQLKNPNIDPLDRATLQNQADALIADMQKYKAYGGFEKPEGWGRGPKAIDTNFGMVKGGSFAPKVQEYETIGSQSSGVPRISVKRPNIVHKITSG